ncbi:MAG TPA: LamG domain-containing protein, partial [Victivallales bacterium]|nr:LamG domain-containing protein [Victivallales bacterium]
SLLGITMFSINMAKSKAKYTKWLAYNTMLNKDPDTVINFNFSDTEAKINATSSLGTKSTQNLWPALMNNAVACNIQGFELTQTHGIIKNAVWIKRGGRNRFHNALYFDGIKSYVEIPNSEAINFNPETTDFTILCWVKFDSLKSSRVICGKAEWNTTAQYTLYLNRNRLEADVGRQCKGWKSPAITSGEWYHIALVSESGNFQIYLNGNPMTNPVKGSSSTKYETTAPFIIGAVMTSSNKTTPRYYFKGSIDEFILIRKALKPSEVKHHFDAGNYK